MAIQDERAEYRDHRVRGEIDRQHIEHQITAGGIEAIAAAREIGQRRAGVNSLVPSGKRNVERTFDNRGAHDDRANRIARGEYKLLAEAFAVAVSVRPTPSARARAADLLKAIFDP